MGFTGKQCIHPAQVDVAQQAFTPSPQAVEWARGLVEAFERHQQLGAVSVHAIAIVFSYLQVDFDNE